MATIIQVERNDLKNELWDIYKQMLSDAEQQAEARAKEMLFTPEETETTLKVSSVTLWRWQKVGYLTPIYIGGKKRYKRSDVMAIIEKGGSR